MTKIHKGVDPNLNSSYLIIQILNSSPMLRTDLFKHVRQQQAKIPAPVETGYTQSTSTYRKHLKSLMELNMTTERDSQVCLTPLGKWLANSKIGTLEDRYLFINNLTCLNCKNTGYFALLKIDPSTETTNAKGELSMSTKCPRCGYPDNKDGVSEVLTTSQFVNFYNQAISELQRVAKTMPQIFLP
jgi:copper chaperone CopZ